MKTQVLALMMSAIALGAPVARADVVTDWNEAALDAIRARNTPPPAAARNLAIVHAAIYDAVNGIERTHDPYLVKDRAPSQASTAAAASAAARTALIALYPADQATFEAIDAGILSRVAAGPARDRGIAWGTSVAEQILSDRADDGSTATGSFLGSEEPGQWRPTVSFGGVVRPALLPLWGQVRPFALKDGSQFRPPAPPALASRRYASELNFVQRMGRSTARRAPPSRPRSPSSGGTARAPPRRRGTGTRSRRSSQQARATRSRRMHAWRHPLHVGERERTHQRCGDRRLRRAVLSAPQGRSTSLTGRDAKLSQIGHTRAASIAG